MSEGTKAMKTRYLMLAAVAAATLTPVAHAEAGDWLFRVGAHYVDPKSDNHPVVNVDGAASLTLNFTYFMTDNWAVELLGAVPFKHDINLNATGAKVGSTTHLPPTLGIQYHFRPNAPMFRPYVAAALNATIFYDEETQGALAGTELSLDNSFGASFEVGADFAINELWAVNVEARWFDIDTDARLDGASLGTVNVDPFAVGVMLTRKFKF